MTHLTTHQLQGVPVVISLRLGGIHLTARVVTTLPLGYYNAYIQGSSSRIPILVSQGQQVHTIPTLAYMYLRVLVPQGQQVPGL